MKNLVIIGGLHGDEKTGIEIVGYFRKHPVHGVESIIANPPAVGKNKRFLETDMNRSFSPPVAISQEEHLANRLKETIKNADLVFDFHNTRARYTTCAIVTMSPTEQHKRLTAFFGFHRLVIMPPSGSLISQNPKYAISFEIANNERKKLTSKMMIKKITELKNMNKSMDVKKLEYFFFYYKVTKATLKRLGISEQMVHNFKPLTSVQKKKLHIPLQKDVYPIFKKDRFEKEAFILVEKRIPS